MTGAPPPGSEFDARAAGWDADPAKVDRARRVASAIVRDVPDLGRRRVLDYGAGTGLLGFELLASASAVTFADVSRGMLEVVEEKIARSGARKVEAIMLDLTRAPAPAGAFDLVCTLMTLHHVEDVPGLLRRFHDALAPGGVACLADLDEEDGSFHGPGFTGHLGFRRDRFAAWLEDAGFGAIRYSTPAEAHRESGDTARSYPIFLAVADRLDRVLDR